MRAGIVAATIAAGLFVVACGGGSVNSAPLQPIPGTTLRQLIADRNDPALMSILTEYSATVSIPTIGVNNAALQALADQVTFEAASGQIGSDLKSLNDALVAAMAQNPGTYFTSNQPMLEQNVTLNEQCSGSIVTPDGYIVTAAHCTQAPPDVLQQNYAEQGLKPSLDADLAQFHVGISQWGLDSDQVQELSDAVTAYLTQQEQVSNKNTSYSGVMFWNSYSASGQPDPMPLSLVTQGDPPQSSNGPFGGKDVSILKLNGYSNLPTVPVGNDASIDAGQPLFVDAYPAAAEAANVNAQSLGTPTLSTGSVNAKMTSNEGAPLLETTATVKAGESGGPGFDHKGVMVGTVSYGNSSYNYLIGASVAQQFLHEKDIHPRPGETTTLFDTALNDYYRHYYKQALPMFQQVKSLDPSHPTVDGFIQKSKSAIAHGKDQTPLLTATQITYLVGAAVALVLLAGVGAATYVILRRTRRSQRASRLFAAPNAPAASSIDSPAAAPEHRPEEVQSRSLPVDPTTPAVDQPPPPASVAENPPQPTGSSAFRSESTGPVTSPSTTPPAFTPPD